MLHLSTFSKTIASGLRLGWMVGPVGVIRALTRIKQAADLHTSTFNQWLALEMVSNRFLDEHLARIRELYHERCQTMLAALEQVMPKEVGWTQPDGGMFVWLRLPPGLDATALRERAVKKQVAFVPGTAFAVDGGKEDSLRLSFSNAPPERIRVGIERLADAVREMLAEVVA